VTVVRDNKTDETPVNRDLRGDAERNRGRPGHNNNEGEGGFFQRLIGIFRRHGELIAVIGVLIAAIGVIIAYCDMCGCCLPPPPDFSLQARPLAGEYAPGQEAQVTVLVANAGGYDKEVSLSANPPPGITVRFEPLSVRPVPAYGSTAWITLGPDVTKGSHSVMIIGTGQDGTQHQINIGIQVAHGGGDAPISIVPGDANQFATLKTLDISDYYFPSGWMGDYQDIRYEPVSTNVSPHGNARSSIEIRYSAKTSNGKGWAGIYWQYPENNWGDKPSGYNLTGFSRLTVWAKGQKGGERGEFKIGGITGEYPDSLQPVQGTGMQTLSTEWKQYSIDLAGKDLSHTIGGFVWVSSRNENPNGCVIYLSEIHLEK